MYLIVGACFRADPWQLWTAPRVILCTRVQRIRLNPLLWCNWSKLIGMIYLKVTGFFGFMITKRFKHPETFVFTKLWNRTQNVSLESRSCPWWNREVETFGGVADRGSHSHLGGQARLSGHFTTLCCARGRRANVSRSIHAGLEEWQVIWEEQKTSN